jgi:hypothetical protein
MELYVFEFMIFAISAKFFCDLCGKFLRLFRHPLVHKVTYTLKAGSLEISNPEGITISLFSLVTV